MPIKTFNYRIKLVPRIWKNTKIRFVSLGFVIVVCAFLGMTLLDQTQSPEIQIGIKSNTGMLQEELAKQVMHATPTDKGLTDRPRATYR